MLNKYVRRNQANNFLYIWTFLSKSLLSALYILFRVNIAFEDYFYVNVCVCGVTSFRHVEEILHDTSFAHILSKFGQ